ncbi:MAG TPA: ABC transporter substrate-binding protein [Chloroflexaceae bacterium]|nr:ABC transporter substrate-binding protein [Chloroflexaceae bacterium]
MRTNGASIVALLLLVTLSLAACGGSTQSPPAAPAADSPTVAPAAPAAPGADTGTINILGAYQGNAEAAFTRVIEQFEAANPGIDVVYSGVGDIDTQIVVKVQAGDIPDIAVLPQPGGMVRLARQGRLAPLWPEAVVAMDETYAPFWKDLGTVDGELYGLVYSVYPKGFVWYNKPAFAAAGYSVPTTWEELKALTAQMKASGVAPWCEGIEAEQATGWKGTDWIENIMLRTQPVEKYDEWVAGTLPFSSPEVKNAFNILSEIWFDPTEVYGGQQTIVLTGVPDAANFLFNEPPSCWLHMQGGFVTGFFGDAVKADLDNQVGTFVLPPIDPAVTPALLVGGDTFMVFNGKDRPEVRTFIEFLTTAESTAPWAAAGGAVFPHQGQDFALYPTGIEGTLAQTVAEAEAARFDGSDQMDAAVNAAFWKGVTDWASGSRDLDGALADIDAAQPK